MNGQTGTHFEKLNLKEKQSKINIAVREKLEIVLWEKGSKDKFKVTGDFFLKEKLQVILDKAELSSVIDKKILYSFSFKGVSFFGSGKLVFADNKQILVCHEDLFKSERRRNFRLLTYPHEKAFATLKSTQKVKESNIVSINTKKSETGLFKDFLQLMSADEDQGLQNSFRLFDFSVTGMGLILSEFEKDVFNEDDIVKDITIRFSDDKVTIPKARVCYVLNMIGNKNFSYKVGLEFLEVDLNLDTELGKIVAKYLRSFESEFEDFIE